jgi:hypothetical protein
MEGKVNQGDAQEKGKEGCSGAIDVFLDPLRV